MKKLSSLILIIINIMLIILIFNIKTEIPEDVNGDGEVNALDLLIVQKYILKENEGEKDGRYKSNRNQKS